ncbi:hypothetical protein OH708_08265 [Pseudomonas capsici]|uniref:hypothetical protein n=1 Tax=Pseudomonas capsici TaxID=2810614 RepID=UPI0021F0DDDF|nr:hypothetical protein [Pseudomonas capsici]MCV4287896.1 hypothetical protein [Pseudomonas capsici]
MNDTSKLTIKQKSVLDELRKIGRNNAYMHKDSAHGEYLYKKDCEKLVNGDSYCVFGMGGLTSQVAYRLGMTAGGVLGIFKALERKGLVISEARAPEYQRPLYWWPAGLADELVDEIGLRCEVSP